MSRSVKPKKKHIFGKIILIVLLVLIVGTVAYGAKVYHDVDKTVTSVYKAPGKTSNKRNGEKVSLSKGQPFSILLLGTDTGELGRTYTGRTDTMIMSAVNPNASKTYMLSIARDSRVKIANSGELAKINSAYSTGGIPNTINTVQNFLNVPVDYYVLMNMKGIEQLVDIVGGVTVNNDLDFTYEGHHFAPGKVTLNGELALKYSRMRYDDPQGDFGRQLRQQEIIKAVLSKASSLNMLTHYNEFLKILEKNMQTNLTLKDIINIQKNYKGSMNFETQQLKGQGETIDGQSFQVMDKNEVQARSVDLRNQLGL